MEDKDLVEDILHGNIESFEILMRRYEMIIVRFVYNMIKDKQIAEDITQEVFITVYNKLELYNNSNKFSSWILQIAKNKCIDYIRKHRKVSESNIEEIYTLKDTKSTPEQIAEFNETKKEIEKFINELDEVDKQIILLKYMKDITFDQIAEILEMNLSAVKRRYYKARDGFSAKRKCRSGKEV